MQEHQRRDGGLAPTHCADFFGFDELDVHLLAQAFGQDRCGDPTGRPATRNDDAFDRSAGKLGLLSGLHGDEKGPAVEAIERTDRRKRALSSVKGPAPTRMFGDVGSGFVVGPKHIVVDQRAPGIALRRGRSRRVSRHIMSVLTGESM